MGTEDRSIEHKLETLISSLNTDLLLLKNNQEYSARAVQHSLKNIKQQLEDLNGLVYKDQDSISKTMEEDRLAIRDNAALIHNLDERTRGRERVTAGILTILFTVGIPLAYDVFYRSNERIEKVLIEHERARLSN